MPGRHRPRFLVLSGQALFSYTQEDIGKLHGYLRGQ
jgi:hypothetical protein